MGRHEQSDRARPRAWLLPAVAVSVLGYLWLDIWIGVRWLPTWAYLGPVTLPWSVFPPMVLGVVVLWRLAHSTPWTWLERGLGVLAVLTLLGGVYAIANLNLAKPGVFFAAILPVGFGFLLCIAVLVRAGRQYRNVTAHSQ